MKVHDNTCIQYNAILYTIDFQNNLRTQAGNTTTVNIVVHTVDYLLRLQVSVGVAHGGPTITSSL